MKTTEVIQREYFNDGCKSISDIAKPEDKFSEFMKLYTGDGNGHYPVSHLGGAYSSLVDDLTDARASIIWLCKALEGLTEKRLICVSDDDVRRLYLNSDSPLPEWVPLTQLEELREADNKDPDSPHKPLGKINTTATDGF